MIKVDDVLLLIDNDYNEIVVVIGADVFVNGEMGLLVQKESCKSMISKKWFLGHKDFEAIKIGEL